MDRETGAGQSAKSKQENATNTDATVKPSGPKGKPRAAAGKRKGQKKRVGKGGRGSKAAPASKRGRTSRSSRASGSRLRPGGLDKIVLANLRNRESAWPLTAAVAKGIGRSSGAVANCLVRLERDKTIRLAKRKPRSYDLKGTSERQPGSSEAKEGE